MNRRKHVKAAEKWLGEAENWQMQDDQANADTCVRIAQTHLMAEETLRAEKVWGPRKVKTPKMATPAAEVEFIDAVDEFSRGQVLAFFAGLPESQIPNEINFRTDLGYIFLEPASADQTRELASVFGGEIRERVADNGRPVVELYPSAVWRGWRISATWYGEKPAEEPAPVEPVVVDDVVVEVVDESAAVIPCDACPPDCVSCSHDRSCCECYDHDSPEDIPAASVPEWTREDVVGWHDQRALNAVCDCIGQCTSTWNGHRCWLADGHTGTHIEGADNSGRVIAEWSPYGVGAEDAAAMS